MVNIRKKPQPGNFERIRDWVRALRSGTYTQATGALKPQENFYCCLGVACDQSNLGEWKKVQMEDGEYTFAYVLPKKDIEEYILGLPPEVKRYYGMRSCNGNFQDGYICDQSLVNLNDTGTDFDSIADLLESQLQLAIGSSCV